MKISLVALIVGLATASAELRGFADEDSNLSILEEDIHYERGLQSPCTATTSSFLSNSYKLDSTKPMFLAVGPRLFDLHENDIDVKYMPDVKKTVTTSTSSSHLSNQLSATMGVEAGYGAFAASASYQTESMNTRNKENTRIDKFIKANKDVLTLDAINPYQKLRPEAKEYLLTQTPQKIMNRFGSFYANQVTVGGIFQLSAVYEMMETETSSTMEAEFQASYAAFFSGSVSGSMGRVEGSSCVNTKFEINAQGGDTSVWLKSGSPEDLQNEWAETVEPGHYYPTDFDLTPIWELLDHADMDPAKAEQVKTYMTTQWNREESDAQTKEDSYELVNSKKTMTGQVTIYQDPHANGNYRYREISKEACDFVNGIHKNTKGFWNLDHLFCNDNTRCLKWGDDCYAGQITLPEGIKVELYSDWDGRDEIRDIRGPTHMSNFWNFDHRICAFRFHLDSDYTCGETPECSTN